MLRYADRRFSMHSQIETTICHTDIRRREMDRRNGGSIHHLAMVRAVAVVARRGDAHIRRRERHQPVHADQHGHRRADEVR